MIAKQAMCRQLAHEVRSGRSWEWIARRVMVDWAWRRSFDRLNRWWFSRAEGCVKKSCDRGLVGRNHRLDVVECGARPAHADGDGHAIVRAAPGPLLRPMCRRCHGCSCVRVERRSPVVSISPAAIFPVTAEETHFSGLPDDAGVMVDEMRIGEFWWWWTPADTRKVQRRKK